MGTEQQGMISRNAIIYPNVRLGANCVVEDYAIIGAPPAGSLPGVIETIIGDNAVIRSYTVIYAGNHIGSGFHTGNKANIRERNEIGNDVSIGALSVVEHHVTIGNGVRVHSQVFIPEYSVLEDESWLGPQVVLTNARYPRSPGAKKDLQGVRVCRAAIVGAHATILPGITIGAEALVGAGSVVVQDVAEKTVVAGNPARPINTIANLPYLKGTEK
jgi:acetyltransferase-like isoleucine patch superfamily enzyme